MSKDLVSLHTGTIICPSKNCKKKYIPNISLTINDIKKCMNFAYSMASGKKHNPDSFASGHPNYKRGLGEIFRDAFQGKVAEVAFYNYYKKIGVSSITKPDFEEWERGQYEDSDFQINVNNRNYNISVKSTKKFGNFLLLEKNRYDNDANYIHGVSNDIVHYDRTYLVRVDGIQYDWPEYYTNHNYSWITAEITGYINHEEFQTAIRQQQYFVAGTYLNGCEQMKVDNYYFCVSKLHKPKAK